MFFGSNNIELFQSIYSLKISLPIEPQQFGLDIDVPLMSCVPRNVQLGTDANAPPGAQTVTPLKPFKVGPLELQVKSIDFGLLPRTLCSARNISPLT